MCFVENSFQQFTAYAASGVVDVYSPFTAAEPIFTSNAFRFGYQMTQTPQAINSQLDETYRVAALYWFLQRLNAAHGRVKASAPIIQINREFNVLNHFRNELSILLDVSQSSTTATSS